MKYNIKNDEDQMNEMNEMWNEWNLMEKINVDAIHFRQERNA